MKFRFRRNSLASFFIALSLACIILYSATRQYVSSLFKETKLELFNLRQRFDINENVLAFLHMQKTGGSDFDRNIVRHLLIRKENRWQKACLSLFSNSSEASAYDSKRLFKKTDKFKKFACIREKTLHERELNWYFSRQTFGWVCGLHPGMTQLKDCITEKIYPNIQSDRVVYFTILREPVRRFLSEWQHVRRGATWKRKNSNQCFSSEYEKCLKTGVKTWTNVSLDDFLACENNPAFNRQVKMLANYDSRLSRCEYSKEQDEELLRRAKISLSSLAFFALNEFQAYSEILLENSLGRGLFKFEKKLEQANDSLAEKFLRQILYSNKFYIEKIKKYNSLDEQLYEYAHDLFFHRLKSNRLI